MIVFRDLQQSEGRIALPTEWHGDKDRSEVKHIYNYNE